MCVCDERGMSLGDESSWSLEKGMRGANLSRLLGHCFSASV